MLHKNPPLSHLRGIFILTPLSKRPAAAICGSDLTLAGGILRSIISTIILIDNGHGYDTPWKRRTSVPRFAIRQAYLERMAFSKGHKLL